MNPETLLTLDDAVEEVLGMLTGLDLRYGAEFDRYRAIARQLNRALRANALEQEWGYYADVENVGAAVAGQNQVQLRNTLRLRATGDDAVRLLDQGIPVAWAYILPRDALHKYRAMDGLWCAVTRQTITFSRPFYALEDGFDIEVPVMREPRMFRIPELPEDPNAAIPVVPDSIRNQPIDFNYPDVVVARAAYYVAMTDPVMQPRAQTLENEYTSLMYQVMERDARVTESPYENNFILPVQSGVQPPVHHPLHPHSEVRPYRGV